MLVFGGERPSAPGDTKEYANGASTNLTSSLSATPLGLLGAGVGYGAGTACVVLFGGLDSAHRPSAETWTYAVTGRTNRASTTSTSARVGPSLRYDSTARHLVLFRGAPRISRRQTSRPTAGLTRRGPPSRADGPDCTWWGPPRRGTTNIWPTIGPSAES